MNTDLSTILQGIQKGGDIQAAEIEQKAHKEAQRIRAAAENEANGIRNRIAESGQERLNRECALIEQHAIMRKMQARANTRQKLIEEVTHKALDSVSDVRKHAEYASILKNLTEDAVNGILPSLITGQKLFLHFDEEDRVLVDAMDISKENITFLYDIECSGGCIAESEDGQVRVLNTIESRFKRAKPFIQQTLSVFFEGIQSSS